jgi:hypothetical protein
LSDTLLNFIIIAGAVLGYFISISILTATFYKNRAHNYLSISLFLLTSISLLGWYDAEEGIFELLHAITWGFLIPVTIFTYFLIQIEHRYLKKKLV